MMTFDLTGTIVLYKNDEKILLNAINSFLNTSLDVRLYLVDNSPTDVLKKIVGDNSRIEYSHHPNNPGFGSSHNYAIRKAIPLSKYHLVLNPDIYFSEGVLESLLDQLEKNNKIGVIMPKVLYPDGTIQYLAKLLPTPLDFFIRRFLPFKKWKEKMAYRFELRASNYTETMDVPFLSGCFLIFRTNVLNDINGFDEGIFMYTEDIDICRRIINRNYRSVFYPEVHIYHDHEIKSFLNGRTFIIYLKSAVYYFNKWGWIFDGERKRINRETLLQMREKVSKSN